MRITLFRLVVLSAIGYGAWQYFATHRVEAPSGVTVNEIPIQRPLHHARSFNFKNYTVTPLAEFEITARVLRRENYFIGREAETSPVDFALGWGPMSDDIVIEKLDITQGNRFYFYRWSNAPPIPPQAIVTHSANMHMIPSSNAIRKKLDQVRQGQIVQISGYLVRLQASDGWQWNSSLTRTDSGNGACELVWVETLNLL